MEKKELLEWLENRGFEGEFAVEEDEEEGQETLRIPAIWNEATDEGVIENDILEKIINSGWTLECIQSNENGAVLVIWKNKGK
jgi:hypothetical protein